MGDTTKPDARQAKASIKEAIGKLTGDVKLQAEGKSEKRSSKSDGRPGTTRTP